MPRYKIGNRYIVFPDQNRIEVGGELRDVEPKVMEVLVYLCERGDQVADKNDIIHVVWDGQFVTENVLARAVSKLRKALRVDDETVGIIKTIPKRGYRLTEPVMKLAEPSLTAKVELGHSESGSSNPGRFVWLALPLALVGWLLLSLNFNLYPFGGAPSHFVNTRPMTSMPGIETRPALSTDGSMVAFVHYEKDSSPHIYVQQTTSATARQLTTGDVEDGSPAWSPDGSQIAFMRRVNGDCSIYSIEITGANLRRMASCEGNSFADLAWSPDGNWLAFNTKIPESGAHQLTMYSLETGEHRAITSPPLSSWGDYDPVFSDDGSKIAFTRALSEGVQDVFVVDLKSGTTQRVSSEHKNVYGVSWFADGRYLLFSSNKEGSYHIFKVSATGGVTTKHIHGDQELVHPRYSAVSGLLMYESFSSNANIWEYQLDDDIEVEEPKRIAASSRWQMYPAISPDNERLSFISNRSGSYELWVAARDGSNPVKITDFDGPFVSNPQWSPDSKRLLFDARPNGQGDIFAINADGGRPEPMITTKANELAPVWSADGNALFFASDESGRWEIHRADIDGSDARQLTTEGGFGSRVSADGRFLYFNKVTEGGIWRLNLNDAEAGSERIIDYIDPGDWGNWQLLGGGIFYLDRNGSKVVVQRFDLATRESKIAFQPDYYVVSQDVALTVSPNGTSLLLARIDNRESDLIIVESADR